MLADPANLKRTIVALGVIAMVMASAFGGVARAESVPTTIGATAAAGGQGTTQSTVGGAAAPAGVISKAADVQTLNPGITLDEVDVQVWPEYDQPAVLVLVDIVLPSSTSLPFPFRFAIPKGAELHGVAEVGADGKFSHGSPPAIDTSQPDRDIVTAEISKSRTLRVEWYFDPGLNLNGQRNFQFLYELPADTKEASLSVQEPARSSGFTVSPPLEQSSSERGMNYLLQGLGALRGGDRLQYGVSYSKSDAKPTEEPESGAAAGTSTSSSTLLIILAALAAGIGGLVAYRKLGGRRNGYARGAQRRSTPARRPTARPAPATPARAARQAGPKRQPVPTRQPAGGADPFCTQCGSQLKDLANFCGSCGAET